MLSSARLSIADLIELCRSLRSSLTGGLMLRDGMDLLAAQGVPRLRPVAGRISKSLKSGWSLQESLEREKNAFPPLFLALIAVGEETGNLPEMLAELEQFYRLQQRLRREFYSEIAWPVVQLTLAILVISGLIYVLGIIAKIRGPGEQVLDPLGMGLIGAQGAITFLVGAFGSILLTILFVRLAQRIFRRRATVERLLLAVPVLGPCLRALAMVRFCISLRLMLETNLSILRTLRLALVATDNAAFQAVAPRVDAGLRRGDSITQSLREAGIFSPVFLGTLAVAEESGRLPEVLRSQAEDFDGEARRRLSIINRIASFGIWILVAAMLITAIFRIFTIVYLSNIEKYLPRERGAPKRSFLLPAPPQPGKRQDLLTAHAAKSEWPEASGVFPIAGEAKVSLLPERFMPAASLKILLEGKTHWRRPGSVTPQVKLEGPSWPSGTATWKPPEKGGSSNC